MAPANPSAAPKTQPSGATGVLVLADGTILWGVGYGASGAAVGEICFNTSMTGYQEILTDPSYAGQIVTFTFPHIGNVGANPEDMERGVHGALGAITRELPTQPSNFRSVQTLPEWMIEQGVIGLAGIATRALTRRMAPVQRFECRAVAAGGRQRQRPVDVGRGRGRVLGWQEVGHGDGEHTQSDARGRPRV